eukprot:2850289-Rhodomonas_salina.2
MTSCSLRASSACTCVCEQPLWWAPKDRSRLADAFHFNLRAVSRSARLENVTKTERRVRCPHQAGRAHRISPRRFLTGFRVDARSR